MKKLISMALSAAMFITLLAGCSSTPAPSSGSAAAPPPADTKQFTVTYFEGETVLKEEKVESGKTAQAYTPEKEGSTFVNWFATPALGHIFDFEAPVTADVSVFAGFSKYQDDTREFFILGSGKSPAMLSSSWGANIADEHKLTKTDGKNEYTITLDLLAGDQFQFAIDSSWANQRGWGYVVDGADAFTGSGGLGDAAAKNQNITCDKDGNYTITLTTFPADDLYDSSREGYTEEGKENFNQGVYDTITWVRNGDPSAVADIVTTYYIKGEHITEWADVYDDTTRLVKDGTKHTLTVELVKGDAFLFTSMVKSGDTESVGVDYIKYGQLDDASKELFEAQNPNDVPGSNLVAKDGGKYTFVYDESTKALSVILG